MQTQRSFAPEGQSVSRARRFVRETLAQWGAEDLGDDAALVASELVTNAVVHAGTTVRVGLDLGLHELRLEVEDLHPRRPLPLGADVASEDEGGRGLLIAAALAEVWGVDYMAGAKRVWVRIARPGMDPERELAVSSADPSDGTAVEEPVVGVVGLGQDGFVSTWSHDAERVLGWAEADVVGRPWHELVEHLARGDQSDPGSDLPSWPHGRWQGETVVLRKSGAPARVFVSQVPEASGEGSTLLVVPASRRGLLEWPLQRTRRGDGDAESLGVREEALDVLGFEAYLDLAVERARDTLSASAAYALLARDVDADFEIAAVSGFDEGVRGRVLGPDTPGRPDARNPHLPVVHDHLDGDLPWAPDSGSRSLLVVPVAAGGRVVGALGVVSERPVAFGSDQAVLLQRLAGTLSVAADRARLRAAERGRRGWLTFLAESAELLAGSLDADMTMAITGQIVVPELATWCALHLDDERGRPVLQQVWHSDERMTGRLRTALERTDPEQLAGPGGGDLVGAVQIIPLVARGQRMGVLTLGRAAGNPLRGEVLAVAESIARRAALAIDNARVHGELRAMGEALQRSLLPASIPSPPTFEVGVAYEAAGEWSLAGGDFYDVFPVRDGRWCFAVGDVCGTGPEAAAVTGLARHTIRALTLAGFPVPAMLERLNAAILEEGDRSRFLTLVCGVLTPRAGGRVHVSMVSAGHPLPFVVRPSGEVAQFGRAQSLLGVLDTVEFLSDELVLDRGDLLVTVTDGVLERRAGPRMMGEAGLMAELAGLGGTPAQTVADRIRRLVADFADLPQTDDMAALAIRVPLPG